MALESATYISELVDTNPTVSDPVGQGDDHLKLIKTVLKTQFSGLAGTTAITTDEAEMNLLDGGYEGTAVMSTSETGTTKFLRVDGDNTSSWQVPPDTNTTYTAGDGLDLTVTIDELPAAGAAAVSDNTSDALLPSTEVVAIFKKSLSATLAANCATSY